MKKMFVKPTLKRYELNSKENIVASLTYNDGTMSSTWKFIHLGSDGATPVHDPDCFGFLTDVFSTAGVDLFVKSEWVDFYSPLLNYERAQNHPDEYGMYNNDEWKAKYNAYLNCLH